jgi:choline dehydrogenase-like flavoprotein
MTTEPLADPAAWAGFGYRDMVPGTRWPAADDFVPRPVAAPGDAYDVVVIGAGAGGGVVACVLAEAGRHVLLVERGESLGRAQLPRDHLRSARVWTGRERPVDLPAGNPRVVADAEVSPADPLWSANAFTVGGGTRVYGAQAWRFCPEDFRMGATYGAPFPDWPIAYDDLEPYYDRVEWDLGACGPDGPRTHDGPRRRGYPMPPVAPGVAAPVLAAGAGRLGIATAAVPLLINSVPYNGRPACIRCGTCVGFACHAAAKTGTHNTVIMRALATGRCDLVTGTAATRLISEGRTVVGVALGDRVVRSGHVVVAAGAIESARLLLVSGVGNQGVGRHLQGHRYAGAVGVFGEVVQDCVGPGPVISTTDFRHHNPGVAGGGILANEFVPTPVEAYAKLTRAGLITGVDELGDIYPRSQFVVGPLQELPRPDSRVTLAAVRDANGVPVARLDAPAAPPEDRRAAALLGERADAWLRAAGAERTARLLYEPARGPSAGQHQAGTCRMGADPATSVTDEWGAVWGHAGVTVADAALHVTNGGVNPVLTVMALAWRIGEHLAR